MKLITYHDVDGEYVALRLQVEEKASYEYDSFLFITCVRGSGSIDGVSLGLGETLLVPAGYGAFELARRHGLHRHLLSRKGGVGHGA